MTLTSDLEVLKDIPGYKPILKAVLKSQIQFLVEQLSDHTGEESVLLTASVADGNLSHLGSNTGRHFIEGHDHVKAMFLTYCLKNGPMGEGDTGSATPGSTDRLLLTATKRSHAKPGTVTVQPGSRKRRPGVAETSTSPAKAMKLTPMVDLPNPEMEDSDDLEDGDHEGVAEGQGAGSGGATGHTPQAKAKPAMFPGNDSSVSTCLDSSPSSSVATSVRTVEHFTDNTDTIACHETVNIKTEPSVQFADTRTTVDSDADIVETSFNNTGDKSDYLDSYMDNIPQTWTSAYDPNPSLVSVQKLDAGTAASDSCTESSEVSLECCFCAKMFPSETDLHNHMTAMHQGRGPRIYPCDMCGKTFNRKFNMEQHKKLHFDIKPHVCDQCGRKFSRPDRMKMHRAGHFHQKF